MSEISQNCKKIAWVKSILLDEAQGNLAQAYASVMDDNNEVENLYLAMSQIPEVINPVHQHYLALLHNPNSPLEPWLGELIATFVAILCDSEYAYCCHGENYHRYYGNHDESRKIVSMLNDGSWHEFLNDRRLHAVLTYTEKLTLHPSNMSKEDIDFLRKFEFDDEEISYVVQLVSSFAYWARIINGLGIQIDDD